MGFTKRRALAAKSDQNISSSLGVTKSRAFEAKSGQNISSSVRVTKSRAFQQNLVKTVVTIYYQPFPLKEFQF